MLRLLSFVAALCLALLPGSGGAASRHDPDSTPAAIDAIDASTGAILRGDGRGALAALAAVPADEFAGFDSQYRACMFARLDRDSPPWLAGSVDDPLARNVLHAYQTYWWRALRSPDRRDVLEDVLLERLRALVGADRNAAADLDTIEPAIQAALEARGYHAQLGRTPPLRELMLWRRQDTRDFEVALPEGTQQVQVVLLDDFVTLGWSAYGRCDRGSNGGWATEEKLFAVVPAYENQGGLQGEAFRVVFLGHEAQHFADKHRFPGLASWELEYRAKLVELVQGEAVGTRRLRSFLTSQGDDPDAPHPYANARVVADLRAKLGAAPDEVPRQRLQQAALQLLREDTQRRLTRVPTPPERPARDGSTVEAQSNVRTSRVDR